MCADACAPELWRPGVRMAPPMVVEDVGEGSDASASEGGNETLVYWVSWLATVSTLGLFSSGLCVA